MKQTSIQRNISLTEEQEEALSLIEEWFLNLSAQIFVLCGYAGTGKTFLVDYVVRYLGLEAGSSAVFVAPTGKAASVLLRNGTPAGTIHSLIYTREEDIEVNEDGEVISEQFLRFVKKEKIDKDIRLIVVDETSMVSDEVLKDLLSFGVKCLFCGDPAQLPPVGGSNSLLSMPCYTLKQIVRQEENNPIVRLAEQVRAGKALQYGRFAENVSVISRRDFTQPTRREYFAMADQIIVGTNRTRGAVNREMREFLGISPEAKAPIDGEKIICTLNNWSKPLDEYKIFHLMNGIVGKCYNVREQQDGLFQLDFRADFLEDTAYDLPCDGGVFLRGNYFYGYGARSCLFENGILAHGGNNELSRRFRIKKEEMINRFEFAYAVTCHKAQGSEYDFVIVFDESNFFDDARQWLYTAITRAKKRLLIVR